MKRFLLLAVCSSILMMPGAVFASHGGGGSHGGSGSHATGAKTVHVRSYVRKDGTVVHSYWRSAPGTAVHTESMTTTPIAPATAARQSVTVPKVNVRIDPQTMQYFREGCTAPNSTRLVSRSYAIAHGYRPAPSCYSYRPK
jgi:hypothetical protein